MLVLIHLGVEGITEVDTDRKKWFVPFKVSTPNDRVPCFYAPSGYSTRKQLPLGRFFEGLQNYMEEKNEVNENKKMLGDFSCTMDQMDTDGENKTQIFYRCCSNYAL